MKILYKFIAKIKAKKLIKEGKSSEALSILLNNFGKDGYKQFELLLNK
jgi:hypothetical protein